MVSATALPEGGMVSEGEGDWLVKKAVGRETKLTKFLVSHVEDDCRRHNQDEADHEGESKAGEVGISLDVGGDDAAETANVDHPMLGAPSAKQFCKNKGERTHQ